MRFPTGALRKNVLVFRSIIGSLSFFRRFLPFFGLPNTLFLGSFLYKNGKCLGFFIDFGRKKKNRLFCTLNFFRRGFLVFALFDFWSKRGEAFFFGKTRKAGIFGHFLTPFFGRVLDSWLQKSFFFAFFEISPN